MVRGIFGGSLALLAMASLLLAQDRPQRGTIKKIDADKGIVTITVDGKDIDYKVVERTILRDGENKEITDRLKDKRLRKGTAVMFLVDNTKENVLRGMRLGGGQPGKPGGGPGDIRRAKIKKIDLDAMVMTLTVDGKDQDFILTEKTTVLDSKGETLKERLSGFKAGSEVQFRSEKRDGKDTLVGLRLFKTGRLLTDTSKLKPLTEMGTGLYEGQAGGLYPDGKNERPKAHEEAGLRLAKEVQPRDRDGKPARDGKIVLLSVGMSNTNQISNGFQQALRRAKNINPRFVFVNGAQGGMTAWAIQSTESGTGRRYWSVVDEKLEEAGVSRAQVQAVWIKQADAGPTTGFREYARTLQKEQANIVRLLHGRFPNLKLVYLSSRTYGGYATIRLNPEPYAYESGFGVKWLIEQQIKGDAELNYDAKKGEVKAPWLSWGPYLWANGMTKREDGFYSEKEDFADDGTHHAAAGVRKMGEQVLKFFEKDSTTKTWFLAGSVKESE
jgi:Cu/Ag efflux protein CusF